MPKSNLYKLEYPDIVLELSHKLSKRQIYVRDLHTLENDWGAFSQDWYSCSYCGVVTDEYVDNFILFYKELLSQDELDEVGL